MAMREQKFAKKNAFISVRQSTTLMKNIFRAAFSSVAYIRDFFDDDCFQLCRIGTTRYHKIVTVEKENVKCYVDWLEKGVFDALQKKYLEVVTLEVYQQLRSGKSKKNSGKRKLLECYTFNVCYTDDNAQLSLTGNSARNNSASDTSKEHIKQSTGGLLRSLVHLASSLDPLPSSRIICLKLLYTKDTPAEYQPPLFREAPEEDVIGFEEASSPMEAGCVSTPYHEMSMVIQALGKKPAEKENHSQNEKHNEKNDFLPAENGTQLREEKKGGKLSEDWDQSSDFVKVGSSDTNSGRVAKTVVTKSQGREIAEDKDHSMNLGKLDVKPKKRTFVLKDGQNAKANTFGQAKKKRKASIVEKDISKKGRRANRSA